MEKILIIVIIFLHSMIILASPVSNYKIKITQPNGKVFDCFTTGDEYYRWIHDKENYTIIQDSKTGYYCYAINQNNELIASKFVVGVDNPAKTGILPGINLTPDKILCIRSQSPLNMQIKPEFNSKSNQSQLKSVNTSQTINNIVIYIRFADQTEFPANQTFYTSIFNSSAYGANSMYNYFREVSYNNLNIISFFYPLNNGTNIISYQDSHIRNYYCPFSATNDSGYIDGIQLSLRKTTLLNNSIEFIRNQIPTSLNLDYNNDGNVDNVCFIIQGETSDWGELLWPHRSWLSGTVYINSKIVYDHTVQIGDHLNCFQVGVLSHEFFHILGAPDLYHYTNNGIDPVHFWDIMANTSNPPQSMGALMKYKYGNWISSIPEITQSGHYSLNPLTSSTNNCYRISSSDSSEYFVLEFRNKSGTFEGDLPGTGLLIYRINANRYGSGDAVGPPDEVYVYRPNGSNTVNGDIRNAYFSSTAGRSTFHNTSNPYCFLSNGTLGNIFIKNIIVSGNTVSFDVRFCNGTNITYSNTNQLPQFINAINKIETSTLVTVKSSDNVTFEAGQEILLNDFEVQLGGQFQINMNGCGNQ